MSEVHRLQLIAEIERKLEELLSCEELSTERKTEVLRELLAMTEMEQ